MSGRVRWGKNDKEEYRVVVTNQLTSVSGKAESLSSLDSEIRKLNEVLVRSAKLLSSSTVKPTKKKKQLNLKFGLQKSSRQ